MTWTILSLIQWASAYFSEKQIDSPGLTAEILLAHVTGYSRMELYLHFDKPMESDELSRYKALIKRRLAGEPVAYITGTQGFWDIELAVNSAVLIPRQDTEILIEKALEVFQSAKTEPQRVLEVGTGTGAITLALASEWAATRFFASDISLGAIKTACSNKAFNHPGRDIRFFVSNWFDAVRPKAQFDVIVSNPPYIPHGEIGKLQQEVQAFEPKLALDGGQSGLDSLSIIIQTAWQHLSPGGWLLLETGFDQKDDVHKLAQAQDQYDNITFHNDYAGNHRVARMMKKNK